MSIEAYPSNALSFLGLSEEKLTNTFRASFSKGMDEARLNFDTDMLRIRQSVVTSNKKIEKMNLPDITHGSQRRVELATDEELVLARTICSDPNFQDSRTDEGLKLVENEMRRRSLLK